MSEFLKVTKQQKEAGTLDVNSIKNTYNMLYPMLGADDRAKLDELIKLI